MLRSEIKFCCKENVENHFWKIMYYNPIELMRNMYQASDNEEFKDDIKKKLNTLIDYGSEQFEKLLKSLEKTFAFRLDNFIGNNSSGE